MALLSLTLPLSSSYPKVAASRDSSNLSSSTSVRKPPATVFIPSPLRNYGGLFFRQSKRRSLQVVRMAPDEEKMTRRSPLDFPIDGSKGKEQKWTQEGSITESLPNGMFRIRLDNDDMIIGYVSGKIRQSFIRILPGDRVRVEGNRYDSTRGRIVYRLRNKSSKD